ncbi:MAG TPA: zinc ribbon domain-containing protein [Polyangia bacterium]|nr:zinc ribbon domain-containing protein [Polyangia bacterium]
MIKSGTLGGSPNPPPTSPGGPSAPDAHAIEAGADGPLRRRLPLWLVALAGLLLAAGYALVIEKMRFGPPMVMFALGGMTLALTAAAFVRVIDPLAGNAGPASGAPARGRRRTRELEREKQLVLKAIKEIELDYQMRKIAERDYREMVERYRTRAMRLMSEIEAGDDFRALIERELAMRVKLEAGKPAAAAAPAVAPPATCPACSTVNDDDAQFCKKCGVKLSSR